MQPIVIELERLLLGLNIIDRVERHAAAVSTTGDGWKPNPLLSKIMTFLVVGVLLLVVGWLSPVPPSAEDDEDQDQGGTLAAPTGPPVEEAGR